MPSIGHGGHRYGLCVSSTIIFEELLHSRTSSWHSSSTATNARRKVESLGELVVVARVRDQ